MPRRPPASLQSFDAVWEALSSNPPVAVGAAIAAVLLIALLWWAVRSFRSTTGERFRDVLADRDSVTVLMHPNPDPDAMASALAVDALASRVDTETDLVYPGQIRRQENRAFATVLDVDFDQIDDEPHFGDDVVLVDHNEPRGFPGAEGIDPVAVVDHHPGDGTGQEFTDVRVDHGACATIFAEYFDDMGWIPRDPSTNGNPNGDDENGDPALSAALSTGLLYGIQSDTNRLTKGCSTAEFRAAEYLYGGVDEDRLDRIANPKVDAEVLDVKARAIESRDVRNPFVVSDVGTVSNVDAIPQAAEELVRLEGVEAVVVYGDRDGTLHLSGRSRDDRLHMGNALAAVVEDIPMAEAGGHARMGGGSLSVEHMKGIGPSEGVDRDQFRERLFDAMRGDL